MTLKIVAISDYFIPGFRGGGPITTLENMRVQLADEVTFSIFTRDRDLGSAEPYSAIQPDQWTGTASGPIYYASPKNFGALGALAALQKTDFDVIYFNSFFSPKASILPHLIVRRTHPQIPTIIAPRGEFSAGALALKRHKKRFFLFLARVFGVYKRVFWHASTARELEDIVRIFPDARHRVFIAADPVVLPPPVQRVACVKKNSGHLRLAFVSRISPMKNLDGLLRVLSCVTASVELNVYGPIEDESYWMHCTELISNLPVNIKVTSHGPVPPSSVCEIFSRHDLFAFPTHGENFGHVVFEALSAGTPVIVSDQTPWQQDDKYALSVIPLCDVDRWVTAIESAASRNREEQERLSNEARNYASNYVTMHSTKKENLDLFFKIARM